MSLKTNYLQPRSANVHLESSSATKTAFSFDNTFYAQTDSVSMGSRLAPVLANIILTELKKSIVDDLQNTGIDQFYRPYVDEPFVLIILTLIYFGSQHT